MVKVKVAEYTISMAVTNMLYVSGIDSNKSTTTSIWSMAPPVELSSRIVRLKSRKCSAMSVNPSFCNDNNLIISSAKVAQAHGAQCVPNFFASLLVLQILHFDVRYVSYHWHFFFVVWFDASRMIDTLQSFSTYTNITFSSNNVSIPFSCRN